MRILSILVALLLALALALAGCGGNESCKNACDKLSSCGLKSSGLSCDEDCAQGGCAECVDDKSCGDIAANACASSCPGVAVTKK